MKYRTYLRLAICFLFLGATVLLSGCGDDDDDDDPTDPGSAEYTFTVPGNTQWLNTALTLVAGDVVTITATGTVSYLEEGDSCGPEGATWTDTADQQDPLWEQPHAGLIAKIEEGGSPFFVGASYAVTLSSGGTLFLGINDFWYDGNSGEFTVTVQVLSGS